MTRQKGQVLVLVAIMLVVLLGMLALALDGGHAYLQRRQMQTAADAGALAAAREYCAGRPGWQEMGRHYCEDLNGAQSCEVGLDPTRQRTVQVVAEITVPTWFAGVIGMSSIIVRAAAQAACSAPAGLGDMLPFAVKLPDGVGFEEGQTYQFWYKTPSQEDDPRGAFGFVDWPWLESGEGEAACTCSGGGTKLLECVIAQPQCAPWVQTEKWWNFPEPGAELNPLIDALRKYWLCNENGAIVPIYDKREGSGNTTEYYVVGFGRFVINGICTGQGPGKQWACKGVPTPLPCGPGDKIVQGEFIESVSGEQPDPNAGYYGVYVVHLLR
jgi:hypothetical protein